MNVFLCSGMSTYGEVVFYSGWECGLELLFVFVIIVLVFIIFVILCKYLNFKCFIFLFCNIKIRVFIL